MCSGWNTESDNNTQFQLNSLMCDLYLRDCFLHQSQVSKSPAHFVFMQILHGRLASLCITLLCFKQIWYYGASQIRSDVHFLSAQTCPRLLFAPLAFVSPLLCVCVLCLTDLEDFKTHRRSPVRVREGQGVVLLCGPPPHSGGKMAHHAVVLIAILQSQSFPLWANISTPRSAKSRHFAQKY